MADNVLARVQREVAEWAQQFGDNPSHHPDYDGVKLFSIPPFLGMVEEIGEMAGPMAKLHQGRKFHNGPEEFAEYKARLRDGLADLLIFACDFARREGIDLSEALDRTWETVKQRRQASWEADKAKEPPLTGEPHRGPAQVGGYPRPPRGRDLAGAGLGRIGLDDRFNEQTGQGFAEPPEEPIQKVRLSRAGHVVTDSYNQHCSECGAPIHKLNSTGKCTTCYVRGKK